jgi:SAM-dependent methyltransferase
MSSCSLLKGYDVVVCQQCGFVFANNIPSQKYFDHYYKNMSKYENSTPLLKESGYDKKRFLKYLDQFEPFIKSKNESIIEIGSATGGLLSILNERRYNNILGVDPSPLCVRSAKENYGINTFEGSINDVYKLTQKFSVLIMVGVLEHIRDLNDSLEKIKNLLSYKGRVFIVVPDASQYQNGTDAPFQEFSIEHINFFGQLSLNNLFRKHGFKKLLSVQSSVEPNYNTITPIITAVYELKEFEKDSSIEEKDTVTKEGIIKYIEKSKQIEKKIKYNINSIVKLNKKIFIWGTGSHTLHLLAVSNLSNANILAYIDSNPRYQGQKIKGIPIISPEEISGRPEPIMISSWVYQHEIEKQIREELHCDNELIRLY